MTLEDFGVIVLDFVSSLLFVITEVTYCGDMTD